MISNSVGQGGHNIPQDVSLVQQLLKKVGLQPGSVDGICGPKTLAAILQYQRQFLAKPDGRIDPNGATGRRLNAGTSSSPTKNNTACPSSEWGGDSSQWSQDKKLASM